MSSTAPTAAATGDERRALRRRLGRGRFHRGWRQALADTGYILTGFVLATAWWVLLVTLISTGTGMVVTLVGLPVLAATAYLWTKIAETERWRARRFLGLDVESPYRPIEAGGLLSRVFEPRVVWERVKDPAVWRDLAYLLLVFFPLAIATFCIAVTAWAVGLGLVALPFYYWTGAGPELGQSHRIDTLPEALGAFAVGLAVILVLPWILGLLAAAHGWTVRSLLGPRTSERVEELTRQRTEAVDAAVAERRRIERDLHDGAQQRLTALAIDLGRARAKLDSDPEAARELVEHAHEDAKLALSELRNLARGIHPAILTDRGLDAALSALAAKSPVPVEISVEIPERPSAAIESTAYFVVAEALTNSAKHAAASRLRVRVWKHGTMLVVEVHDDGVGGAHLEPGGGLEGLTTRVATVDGTLSISSPDGGPTVVRAELPCAS
jgi:signal transduction histidine kinase